MIDDLMKHYGEHKDLFYDRLETALRTARNKALEEAAIACEKRSASMPGEGFWGDYDAGQAAGYDHCTSDIRQLKHKDGQP